MGRFPIGAVIWLFCGAGTNAMDHIHYNCYIVSKLNDLPFSK